MATFRLKTRPKQFLGSLPLASALPALFENIIEATVEMYARVPQKAAAVLLAHLLLGAGNTKGGKYHCTVDLLFDWFGLVCFANKNKYCQLLYS
jgi:hypothetical protein